MNEVHRTLPRHRHYSGTFAPQVSLDPLEGKILILAFVLLDLRSAAIVESQILKAELLLMQLLSLEFQQLSILQLVALLAGKLAQHGAVGRYG